MIDFNRTKDHLHVPAIVQIGVELIGIPGGQGDVAGAERAEHFAFWSVRSNQP